jgi:ABC-type antimicrobial peptide transport system permease subunit
MLRPSGDPAAITATARRAVADLDPAHPLVDFGVVTRALDARMPELARYVATVSAFGVVALLLAAIGVYGVTAFAVAARTTEIGVRRALGAGTRDILMAAGARIVLLGIVGIAIGLALAAGTTRLIASQLVGVDAIDPATFLGVAMLMAAAALLACAAPLRRTLHVDPASVLRSE